MIKTFKVANDTAIKTGLVQIQPAQPARANSNSGTSTNNTKPPPNQVPLAGVSAVIAAPAASSQTTSLKSIVNPTLSSLASSITAKNFILPTIGGGASKLIPSFHIDIDPSVVLPSSSDALAVTTKKFEPYELQTGISQERPEVVMMTNFLPLYKKTISTANNSILRYTLAGQRPQTTDAGEFFNTQVDVRSLRVHQVKHLLTQVKRRYMYLRAQTADRSSAMSQALSELESLSLYLWTVMRTLEKLKQQLDLRDDVHIVDPHETLRLHLSTFSSVRALSLLNFLTPALTTYFPPQYDVPHALTLYGYTEENAKHTYTSSKLWMQLMLEYKHVLQTHSLNMLDIDPAPQRNDSSPVAITQTPSIKRFDYTAVLPTLPSLDSITQMQPPQIPQYVNSLISSYNTIYQGVSFKHREMQLACLINALSREHRYSLGLSKPEVQKSLQSYYGYQVSPQGNLQMFDRVVGQFGSNITDFPALQSKTLASLAQQQVAQNVAVLPFESRYVEGDTGTLTPGSSYYVDSVLLTHGNRYDVTRLIEFRDVLQNALTNFNVIVDGLDLLQSEYVDQYSNSAGKFASLIANPRSLFDEIRAEMMTSDAVGLTPEIANDPLLPLFTVAQSDTRLRSLLLLYVVTKMSKAYLHNVEFFDAALDQDNTPTSDALVDLIVKQLISATKQTSTTLLGTTNQSHAARKPTSGKDQRTVNIETVRTALKTGSGHFLAAVISMMGRLLATFKRNNAVFNGSVTRYGGHPDTVIFMSIVDIFTSFIDLYGDRHVVGQHIDQGQTQLIIDARHVSHTNSVLEVDQRLGREIMLSETCSFTVMNSLTKLINSVNNVINYLNGPESLAELQKVTGLLSDPSMLHMLLSEQQIRLLSSNVADLRSALAGHSRTGNEPGDINGDGEFDSDDELIALDDAEITPKIRRAIDDMLSTDEFTQASAASRKILTVGIPLGFSRHLQQKVDIKKLKKTSFDVRQNDVVNIAVYKVDMQNPDIVYKPQRFMFELSRFPVRNDVYVKDSPGVSKFDIVSRFPTRDASQAFSSGGSVQYIRSSDNEVEALDGEDYDFLTRQEKDQLYVNHVFSYLLEVYLRTMTGISTADYHFDMVDPPPQVESDFVNLLLNHYVNHVSAIKQQGLDGINRSGIFFGSTQGASKGSAKGGFVSRAAGGGTQRYLANSAGIAGLSTTVALSGFSDLTPNVRSSENTLLSSTDTVLAGLPESDAPLLVNSFGVLNEFSRMTTPLADPLAISQRIINPKQFDRVFNLLVDPYSFEIDVSKTQATPHGKQALELMIKQGEIEPTASMTSLRLGNASLRPELTYVQRRRDNAEGDLIFEKYIVSVETVGEDQA